MSFSMYESLFKLGFVSLLSILSFLKVSTLICNTLNVANPISTTNQMFYPNYQMVFLISPCIIVALLTAGAH
jgi:hypothetical protein